MILASRSRSRSCRRSPSSAHRGGEALVGVRCEGKVLVVHVEGAGGDRDATLLPCSRTPCPAATLVELNRVPGQKRALGPFP